jgi:hypothetical protein
MNERIQELALAAGKYADETQPRGSYTRDGIWLYAYNEKFAELIVRECIDISTDVEDEALQNREFKAGSAATLIKVLIKKHFGVEE